MSDISTASSAAAGLRYQEALLPHVLRLLEDIPPGARILDAGCGNGFFCRELLKRGYRVTGVDHSPSCLAACHRDCSGGEFHLLRVGAPELPSAVGGGFDAVVSTEVIEHLPCIQPFFQNCRTVLAEKGVLLLSTPYHGYWKNLLLALSGRLESHLQPQVDGGHVKFWSRRTLEQTLKKSGFEPVAFAGCGRIPHLWNSMLIKAVRTS